MSARRIAVVTGSRADYGLLRPVMSAIARCPELSLQTIVAGAHLLPPDRTIDEVAAQFEIAVTISMQSPDRNGRGADALALGDGVSGFAKLFNDDPPDIALVLGDRIEAFAAAAAAAVAGIRVAHMHGGDRAQGIADDSLRHAISKLAHIHFPATTTSAQRLVAMAEQPQRIHVVGSPAIDGLSDIPPMSDAEHARVGRPQIIVLLHPVGDDDETECSRALELLRIASGVGRTLALHPNHDPGRNGIMRAIEKAGCTSVSHLPRSSFIGLLRRVRMIVGNSSAGLIEASAIPIRCINVGNRQAGREKSANIIDVPDTGYQTIAACIAQAMQAPALDRRDVDHPYGDGKTGPRVAKLLAALDLNLYPLTKRNTY